MLYLANNQKIPLNLYSARRFKSKLGKQLENVCVNSAKLLSPARALSIDEMMVKFYGRSEVRQYIQPSRTNTGSNCGPSAVPVAVIPSHRISILVAA